MSMGSWYDLPSQSICTRPSVAPARTPERVPSPLHRICRFNLGISAGKAREIAFARAMAGRDQASSPPADRCGECNPRRRAWPKGHGSPARNPRGLQASESKTDASLSVGSAVFCPGTLGGPPGESDEGAQHPTLDLTIPLQLDKLQASPLDGGASSSLQRSSTSLRISCGNGPIRFVVWGIV